MQPRTRSPEADETKTMTVTLPHDTASECHCQSGGSTIQRALDLCGCTRCSSLCGGMMELDTIVFSILSSTVHSALGLFGG